MKILAPALILALAACSSSPHSSAEERPIAKAPTGQQTSTQQAQNLGNKNVGGGQVSEAPAVAAPAIDPSRRFEYVDVTIEMGKLVNNP